jgi:hypothetical protein
MPNLLTTNFKTHMARQFVESINESANTIYYVNAHKSTQFDNDLIPPTPENSVQGTNYVLYDDIIFGKHVKPTDVKFMIRNIPWQSGTVYDIYDDKQINLENKNFYAVSPESGSYHVFKCLNNSNGDPSTSQPLRSQTNPSDEIYVTSDNYNWKYLFSISSSDYDKFATSDFIPFIENPDVTANAVPGAISTIVINNPGSQYNSYATGTIYQSAVGGNTLIYALNSNRFTDYSLVLSSVNNFIIEQVTSINSANNIATGVIVSINNTTNTVIITSTTKSFNAGKTLVGSTSGASATIVSAAKLTAPLSSNSGFYDNNSFYIRSGTGAGQLRTITDYIVNGDNREVLLDSALTVLPDSSSIFEISPRVVIIGDGINANAIVSINPSSNSISEIEIIGAGSGYTYADITIVANTGLIDNSNNIISSNNAVVRAIISPPGGHGSNVIDELYASRVGIGVSFSNTESNTIPASNDYRRISILKDPLFANVNITLDSSVAMNFSSGETVIQANTGATGTVSGRSGNILTLTNIRGFLSTGNSTVNYLTGTISNATASVTALDRTFDTFDQRQTFQVSMLYTGPLGTGFQLDEKVVQPGFIEYVPTGYVHSLNSGSTSSVISLTDVKSVFSVSDFVSGTINTFVGQTSGAIAELTGQDFSKNYLVDGSGEFLYVENFTPITRQTTQSEKIKLIIEF